MSHFEHNVRKIRNYWNDYSKTGRSLSLARCNEAVLQPRSMADKIAIFKNAMYTQNSNERKNRMSQCIYFLFNDEVLFVFENRRMIREKKTVSFSSFELFNWMKRHNEEYYKCFKMALADKLKDIINTHTDVEKKNEITYVICEYLFHYYIRL